MGDPKRRRSSDDNHGRNVRPASDSTEAFPNDNRLTVRTNASANDSNDVAVNATSDGRMPSQAARSEVAQGSSAAAGSTRAPISLIEVPASETVSPDDISSGRNRWPVPASRPRRLIHRRAISEANSSGPSNNAPSGSQEAAQGQPRESRRSISGAQSRETRRSISEAVTNSHVDEQIPPPQFRKSSSQTIIRKEVGSSSRNSSRGHPPAGPQPSPSVPSSRESSGRHPQNKPLPPRPDESPARSAILPSSRESSGHHPQNKPLPARPVESQQTPIKDASVRNDSPSIFNSTPPENPPGPAIAPRSTGYDSSIRNLDCHSSTGTPPLIDLSASLSPLPRNVGQGSDQKRKLDFNMSPLKPSSEKPSKKPVLRLFKSDVEGQQSSATESQSSHATPTSAPRNTSADPNAATPWRGPTLEQRKSASSLIDVNGPVETSGDIEKTPTAQQPQRPVFPDPDSPTLKAFKTEPPREGPGFDGQPAPEPVSEAPNRPHVWIHAQRLPDDEPQKTIETYNELFSLNQESRQSLLPRAHRYPDYGRDDEAARRKAEFERQTGESMSDADYYSLFDQTTATDGMISSLMEFMEGREYVKAPYVNRIIHQLMRMMYQSAREESRLRDSRKRECDLLKRKLEDCEKRCGGKIKKVSLDTAGDREKTLRLIKEMWDRMDGVMEKEEECIRDHNHKWRNREETLRRNDTSFREWRALDERHRSLRDERQHLENLIASRSDYHIEDLGQLKDVDDRLQRLRRKFSTWLEYRTNMLIDWIGPIGNDDVDGSIAKLRDIHSELRREVALLNRELDALKRIADFQREAREVQARSMIDVTADSRQPTLPQVSTDGSPPEDSQPRSCSGCRSRDDQIWEKDRMLKEQTKLLKLGVYTKSATEKQRDKLREALEQVYSDRIQTAVNTIGSYRTLVIDEMGWEMDYLNRLLHAQVGRTKEQADLFRGAVDSLRDKDPANPVLQELENMHNSVQRLADTTEATQRSFGQQLDRMVSNRATHLNQATQPDEEDQPARDGLVTSLRSQVEELTRRVRKMSERNAHENLKVVDKVRQDMERQISDLQDRIGRYKTDLQQQRKEVEADLDSTLFRDQLSTSQLFAKEAELRDGETECRRIEGTARKLQTELDNLKAAYDGIEKLKRDLEGKVLGLEIRLEERNETDRWSLWDGTNIEVTGNGDPESRRQGNINKLQRDLVAAIAKSMNEGEKNTKKGSRSASAKFTKLVESAVRKLDKKKADEASPTSSIHETEKKIEAVWRMVDFQRRRAEVVSLIRSSRAQQAKDRLGELLRSIEHYKDYWPEKQHEYEAFRSMHYLQAYVNMALATMQVRMGEEYSTIARESMETARGEFLNAERYVAKLKERPGADGAWQAMGRYLHIETQRSVEELQQCDCKFKTRPCRQHSRDGSAAYYDFMQAPDDQAQMELPRSVQSTLEPYGRSASNYTMDPRRHG